jgi:hypothetical protein
MKKVLMALCALFAFAAVSPAGTPIKLSLWDKIAVPNDDSVCGLEIGIGTYTSELVGAGWNFIYSKTDKAKAWQTGLVTISKEFSGLQSGFVNLSETLEGVSYGYVNYNSESLCGVDLGWLNWSKGEVTGVQWGFLNIAESVSGLQLGFVNFTENMKGIQIGLVNFIKTGKLPVMIIANAKF